MDWLTFISNLVDAVISWPVAIIAVAYMLREPLKGLLRALENFETFRLGAGGVSVDVVSRNLKEVNQDIKEVEQELEQKQEITPAGPKDPDEAWFYGVHSELIDNLLSYHPAIAVDEAWRILEQEIRALAMRNQEGEDIDPNASIESLTRQLEAAGLVPSHAMRNAILRLKSTRNDIMHSARTPPLKQAVSYVQSALALAYAIRRL